MIDISPGLVIFVWVVLILRFHRVTKVDAVVIALVGYYVANTWLASAVGALIGIVFAPKGA
jgi:Na+/H+-dicarboxylate symporter